PIAEKMEIFPEIGRFTIRQAILDQRRLEETFGRKISVAVNLSASQFESDQLFSELLRLTEESYFPGERLILEIREEVLQTRRRFAMKRLEQLRQAGYRLTVDHFGSHYASLNSLLRLPVQAVKLDPIFTRRLVQNQLERSMIRSVHSLTSTLNIALVIQEVETASQLQQIQVLDEQLYVQGYEVHHPQPIEQLLIEDIVRGRAEV
ncbi:MAG TPA: diguanylate cyclase, partial [Exiguobacterium sp.]|nr:diguanylate cyclase [Exiguobacterium sp.]